MGVRFAMIGQGPIADRHLSLTDLRVLLVLALFADRKSRRCYPKRETIATLLGITVRQVSLATSRLQERGWISKAGHGGRSCPALYQLLDGLQTEPVEDDGEENGESSNPDTSEPKTLTPEHVNPDIGRSGANDTPQHPNGSDSEGPHHPRPPSRSSTRRTKTPIPADFAVTDDHRRYAAQNGLPSPDECLARFILYYRARGTLMACWDSAFLQWLSNEPKFRSTHNEKDRSISRPAGNAADRNSEFFEICQTIWDSADPAEGSGGDIRETPGEVPPYLGFRFSDEEEPGGSD